MVSERTLADAIRVLSMDAVQKAHSGHPGMPMGMADIATVLWRHFLRHNPKNPQWSNRDRFILSNGHGSMLHYACLHLAGYDLSLEDLKQFRQLNSKTPGHPEYDLTIGIETTTGPLGQGFAHATGMALAEKLLSQQFNKPNFPIIDHYTYVFLGDGCLMEGVSHEVGSLASTLGLGKLIAFWDNNGISIDGPVEGWFNDDTPKRFEAYGWHIITQIDGHDHTQVREAISVAQTVKDKPSLLCCKTQIGFGSPQAGTAVTHGAPLGIPSILATRCALDWPYEAFVIPDEIYDAWDAKKVGHKHEQHWQTLFTAYQSQYPRLARELLRRLEGQLPKNWFQKSQAVIQETANRASAVSTRKASQQALGNYSCLLPELFGGSADLTESNATFHVNSHIINRQDTKGNYLHYGVREFGMSAIMLGIALHGGFIPYGGTFLAFSDYARPAIRLAAITKQRVIFVFTHDSIGLGEDGPTHQPIEQLASLRLIPNVAVWRPCDAVETAVAWQQALQNQTGPSCLILSRQTLPTQSQTEKTTTFIKKGGYILVDCNPNLPLGIFLATGSEVALAVEAAQALNQKGLSIRVVSLPSTSQFLAQGIDYQEKVLPKSIKARIAIEAGSQDCWYFYVGDQGIIIGLNTYGKSAPGPEVFRSMGITVEKAIQAMERLLDKKKKAI